MPEGMMHPDDMTELSGYVVAGGVDANGKPAVMLIFTERDGGRKLTFPMHPREARGIAAGLDEAAARIERKLRGD